MHVKWQKDFIEFQNYAGKPQKPHFAIRYVISLEKTFHISKLMFQWNRELEKNPLPDTSKTIA